MKRVIVATLATLVVISMAFVSCTQKKPAEVTAPAFRIGLVTDIGGIDDKSFNQGTWEGIVRFAKEAGLKEGDYKYLQSAAEADYIPNLSTFSDEKLDLIAAPGFLFR